MKEQKPDYKRIYQDLICMKFPEKFSDCEKILCKKEFSALDVINLNNRLFGDSVKEIENFNMKHRSYTKSDVLKILNHQKMYKLNDSQLAIYFKLSRNTVSKWKKKFV